MSYNQYNVVNFKGFVDQYMGDNARTLTYTQNPIKLYPLSIASSLIKIPTPLFRADYNFLLLFSRGGGEQQVDNEVYELQANDLLFIREGHLNSVRSIYPETEGYYIYIDSTLLPQLFIDKMLLNRFTFFPKQSVSQAVMNWTVRCCELVIESAGDNMYAAEMQVSLLRAIILKLAEALPGKISKPDRRSEITILFQELLYENFLDKRDVQFYADSLAVSENYLNRCVKYTTNKPPKQHINEVVIYHSKVLLQDPNKDISQISYDLNFTDPSYFGRLFKQLTRQSPTEYRNSIRHDLSE
jgi:AraC-like DNA-binding protein